ncbi:hypothetical protein ACFS2C_06675 [Prauserella oleivorans]|uniref:Uncharacterized protein n=1 Tax=Prauserella oleivorans TaxID=1478153 RepID=A0ABW5W7I1_9PSEU
MLPAPSPTALIRARGLLDAVLANDAERYFAVMASDHDDPESSPYETFTAVLSWAVALLSSTADLAKAAEVEGVAHLEGAELVERVLDDHLAALVAAATAEH